MRSSPRAPRPFEASRRPARILGGLAALALLAPTPAARADTGVFAKDFCGAPVPAVCGTLSTSPLGRQVRLMDLVKDAARAGLTHAARALKKDPRTFSLKDLQALPPRERAIATGYFQAGVYAHLASAKAVKERKAVQEGLQKLKGLLFAAIRRTFPSPVGLTSPTALQLESVINGVQIVDSGGLEKILRTPGHPDAVKLSVAFKDTCGPDGLQLNAFAYTLAKSRRYLVVCPGLLLSAMDDRDTTTFENVMQILLHELAHHIDYGDFPKLYAKLERCLNEHHGDALKANMLVSDLVKASKAQVRATAVRSHMNEIVADLWGVEALRPYLALETRTRDRQLWALRHAWGVLCGSPDDGVHPSGDFRIGVLLRTDLGVLRALGCADQILPKPTCSLTGPKTHLIPPKNFRR